MEIAPQWLLLRCQNDQGHPLIELSVYPPINNLMYTLESIYQRPAATDPPPHISSLKDQQYKEVGIWFCQGVRGELFSCGSSSQALSTSNENILK